MEIFATGYHWLQYNWQATPTFSHDTITINVLVNSLELGPGGVGQGHMLM